MNQDDLIRLAKTDPRVIIESLFYVENKEAQIVPFKFNEVQIDLYESHYKKLLNEPASKLAIDILKARQQGFSTLILALFTVDFMVIPNIWCVCVSHESEATKRLFRKVLNFIKRLPFELPLDTSRTDMIVNKLNGSVFYIGTAGSRAFGQGDTIHNLHLSELSRYSDPERIVKNIIPAVPDTGKIIKETTANGFGNYHQKEWAKEKSGIGAFDPFFSGWNRTREYAIEPTQNLAWTVEEKALIELYRLTPGQINWRRMKIRELGSIDSFKEQYPINDLEAFISSGASAFNKESLGWYYENVCREPIFQGVFDESASPRLQEDPKGYLKQWEKPLPNSQYFIAADVGKSGDYSAASVWHWGRNEQVITVNGHFEPDEFGRILYKLGAMYNYATIIPENNGIGAGVVATLRVLDYPNVYSEKTLQDTHGNLDVISFGFNTNTKTRPLIIAAGQKAIRERTPIIRDNEYIMEMQAFQRNKDGKYEAATDERGVEKDDRVMEFLIGQYYYQTNPMPDFAGFGMMNPIAMPDSQAESGIPSQTTQDTGDVDFSQ